MIISLLKRALMMSTPLLFGSIAEVIAERSGMMVTAIEGIFLMGAWGGFVGTYLTGSAFIGILAAIFSGLVAAAVYGVVCIYLKQHQVVTGTAINVLAAGICTYLQRVLFGVPTAPLKISPLPEIAIPVLSKIPVMGPVFFQQNILTYVVYLLIPASYFLLFKTSLGLTIRSTGENPEAVDVAGINVNAVRFFTVLLAGVMGGIAGAFYSVGYLGMFTTNIIGGRGWIAFAICFLGNWNPKGAVLGTVVFGLTEAIAIYMQSVGGGSYFPNELFIALPYLLTIILTVSRRNFNVPAKLGVAYSKEN
ncbi:simple sugar transport system permease protein [Lacrimispora sphenoides]|jgi:simple sugar transport system permease protein|uniref:Simple sugar transport system permease protein n=1 Tax=Lacrimispora sphenoides JCM 1415 TaxID=1297793 RepID=A0ABY1C907_9FIRM|nr:ABC transporter permease [Lacrimispora sphenoides]SET80880.1 simple sugar transport system permease protein [[Clostridium] sphenoides JCM 1415]SEU33503.1 simple sugar transport system permease protein [Lacrimispora sphenoides]SUY51437.1 inner-membrane translocator [Lacrimispora sphenoides]